MASSGTRASEMDINEFEATMAPKAKRSKMEPWRAQIFELKGKGYANWQIKEFLARNGLEVTVEAVRKFIKSREGKPLPPGASQPPATPPATPAGKPAGESAGKGVESAPSATGAPGSAESLETVLSSKDRTDKFESYQAGASTLANKLRKEGK